MRRAGLQFVHQRVESSAEYQEAPEPFEPDLIFFLVTESVETEEQAQRLTSLSCDEAQGYLFSRPQPAVDITKALALDQATR